MPLTLRSSARRRRTNTDEKPLERPGESPDQVMAPTRMKLRARRRDNAAGAEGDGQPEEGGQRSRENGGGSNNNSSSNNSSNNNNNSSSSSSSNSSRRKNTSNTSTTTAATNSASTCPPSSASASASARTMVAAEDTSPDSKCPICLDRFNNLAYLDRCLHRFCFPCIQEWSYNKPECPLCKQPFASILHSVRAENDFKEYTLRPTPANNGIVALVEAMAARSDSQMRLMLRRHRGEDGRDASMRRRRRERGGRGWGRSTVDETMDALGWYFDAHARGPNPTLVPMGAGEIDVGPLAPFRVGADLVERGIIFHGLTGLGRGVAPEASHDRIARRLMSRLTERQRIQRDGGTLRRLRERETVAFRRDLYRCAIQVRGVPGVSDNPSQHERDITAASFRENPGHLSRLRPWLRRELMVLYGTHAMLNHIVQQIIMDQLAHHGLEDTPNLEEELRPFLLMRTEHFVHELLSFARSPLSMDNYDLQAVYEPPAATMEVNGVNSSSDSNSVIAISEGEEDNRQGEERSEEIVLEGTAVDHDDIIQTGGCLSLSAWDDETPGPSYSAAEAPCSLVASLSVSPAPQEAACEGRGDKPEEECLIVGYKKPIAERTPELVQLSSDTEDEEKKKVEETLPPLPSATPPLSDLPTVPPSTSGAYRDEQDDKMTENDCEPVGNSSCARSRSCSSGKSRESVLMLSPCAEQQESWGDERQSGSEAVKEKENKKKRKRRKGQERSSSWLKKTGTLYNPNRAIYPAMMHRRSRTPSPFHSSAESGSPLPPSPPDSNWEYNCSPLTSSVSSPSRTSSSSSSPLSSSAQPSPTPQTPSQSPSHPHHGEKPGGKRKYKSRHLDSNDKDPTWRPSSSQSKEKRKKKGEKKRDGRDGGRKRERHRRDRQEGGDYGGESSSRRCRDDRSPSVEIIYEGTVSSDPAQPSPCKRRRKRQRGTQHSSSPVIITLDSDSGHDDMKHKHTSSSSSSSSSPLSSQQTVDFSDLPALPLAHSAGVGGALEPEIGELPVDILDRGSDCSEAEPAGRSQSAGPIAIDNSDNSDREVDVENVEESSSLQGCGDADRRPRLRAADAKAASRDSPREAATEVVSMPTGGNVADLATVQTSTRDSEVLTSDSRLLATILDDLKGITAPRCDYSNFEACSPETTTKAFRDPQELNEGGSHQDSWLAETLPEERRTNEVGDQIQDLDLPTHRTAFPLPPPLEQLKDCSVAEQDGDLQPPPLNCKYEGCAHLSPIAPVHLPSAHTSDTDVAAELPKNHQVVPSISALKKHFTDSAALRAELDSTSHSATTDPHPASNAAHPLTPRSHCSQIPPAHSHPSVSETSSTQFHSLSLPAVNCTFPPGFRSAPTGTSAEQPAHVDSTSGGLRNVTLGQNACGVAPTDAHSRSRVSAEATLTGNGLFSGVKPNDTSPAASASSVAVRTLEPHSPTESHLFSLLPTAASSSSFLPVDVCPRSPKPPVEPHPCISAELANDKVPLIVNHEGRAPRSSLISGHSNHTASPPSPDEHDRNFHMSHREAPSQPAPTPQSPFKHGHLADSHSGPANHFAARPVPPSPSDSSSKVNVPTDSVKDFELRCSNRVASPPRPAETRWDSNTCADAQPDSQSASRIWTTDTLPHRTDK